MDNCPVHQVLSYLKRGTTFKRIICLLSVLNRWYCKEIWTTKKMLIDFFITCIILFVSDRTPYKFFFLLTNLSD